MNVGQHEPKTNVKHLAPAQAIKSSTCFTLIPQPKGSQTCQQKLRNYTIWNYPICELGVNKIKGTFGFRQKWSPPHLVYSLYFIKLQQCMNLVGCKATTFSPPPFRPNGISTNFSDSTMLALKRLEFSLLLVPVSNFERHPYTGFLETSFSVGLLVFSGVWFKMFKYKFLLKNGQRTQ